LRIGTRRLAAIEKRHRDPELCGIGGDPHFGCDLRKERTRNRSEQASAIARQSVGRDGTAVAHAGESGEGRRNYGPRSLARLVRDKANSAGVSFDSRSRHLLPFTRIEDPQTKWLRRRTHHARRRCRSCGLYRPVWEET